MELEAKASEVEAVFTKEGFTAPGRLQHNAKPLLQSEAETQSLEQLGGPGNGTSALAGAPGWGLCSDQSRRARSDPRIPCTQCPGPLFRWLVPRVYIHAAGLSGKQRKVKMTRGFHFPLSWVPLQRGRGLGRGSGLDLTRQKPVQIELL